MFYPRFFDQPGSITSAVGVTGLVAVYAAGTLIVFRAAGQAGCPVLRMAGLVGMGLGLIEVANISLETFTDIPGRAGMAATAPLILGPFIGWGLVAVWTARRTAGWRLGVLAAAWTAMVTMTIGVTYGLALALVARPRMETILAGDPDFVRSGWLDLRAFVLANTFDNALTHLLGGLIVATLVGLLGSLIGQVGSQRA
ncbi:MAG TPA: hypothetical protein VIY28_07630 [Pseudonocardiaceae bacterium]